MAYRMRS
jgi:hypothetical protein